MKFACKHKSRLWADTAHGPSQDTESVQLRSDASWHNRPEVSVASWRDASCPIEAYEMHSKSSFSTSSLSHTHTHKRLIRGLKSRDIMMTSARAYLKVHLGEHDACEVASAECFVDFRDRSVHDVERHRLGCNGGQLAHSCQQENGPRGGARSHGVEAAPIES